MSQKLACRVERVVAHGERVYTLVLRPERPVPRFRAGQFLHLALDRYDPTGFWPESRVFSIASPPGEREAVRITYAVKGRFTARMETEAVEGREVWIKLPYGEFFVDPESDVALFAGGTGVTAFTAFLEALRPDVTQRVALAYGARTEDLLIYRDVIARCAARTAAVDVQYFVEHAGGTLPETRSGPSTELRAGRVAVDAVWPRLRDPRRTQYYISGPPPMLAGIAQDLRSHGVDSGAIHVDAWE